MSQLLVRGALASFALTMCAVSAASAQTGPHNERPDLGGIWTNRSLTPLERPDGVETLVLSEAQATALSDQNIWKKLNKEQAAPIDVSEPLAADDAEFATRAHAAFWVDPGTQFGKVNGEYRSSIIVEPANGRVPWKPEGQQLLQDQSGKPEVGGFDGVETRPNAERCFMGRAPVMHSGLYNNTQQFVQTQDYFVIILEMGHDARIIPTFETPEEARNAYRPEPIRPWMGDSVGWYEGDELIVETINQNRWQRMYISATGKVTERFKRVAPDQILYRFTVEDPSLYTQTWSGEQTYWSTPERPYEYACHEGNYALPGILRGARVAESGGAQVENISDVEQ